MKKPLKLLIVLILFVLLFAPIYTNITVTTDYREGQLVPLTNFNSMVFDSPVLSIAKLYFGEISPSNYIFYLGGYPAENSLVHQHEIQTVWNPTDHIFIVWFIY
ncbi:TPA: hypothetical protein DIU27_05530 [Candidatus Collierbacteria bacterium]|uniref:Uncharacterized protein n=1 Tax=Candidatus Collierbacteria bacterium GW2011_GWB2_44_22 TaxID=1618387 RepID=A0A0G1HWD4_9BACT|nr:MAG: hypothetical protein UW31_C0002G0077 [Candidatus Collierbacteria bacterium GW2011_GWA2_44_13]KKT49964.1 MAG: hypothetical protein UW42_C0028G0005 [Candidatus Collierbacteria bacterium GW2011_GWB1_44_197]KKT50958.1 MAG: hypothetical protein UW44_C0021G0004 [Candidatus Collierbacteria bacterium GW2011_GWB2_44_22]KKT62095.1 MAG: hypothetical protein UW56_C0012G0034 [Candidatus Collierbacteria bacterium GW2011_GWD1_44_27]KKT64794.1 MAG: hypothetical protein UW58_C0036G0004 [Candidatus Colli